MTMMMVTCSSMFLIFTLTVASTTGAKITRSPHKPVSAVKTAPNVYQGQVFILRESDDKSDSPFTAELVYGNIEMVQPNAQPSTAALPTIASKVRGGVNNDSQPLPDSLEDPEYFAVMVTPDTAALTQIPPSSTIKLPLSMVLTAFSKRMPWVLVLKKKNHWEYFRNIESTLNFARQIPMQPMSNRRRSRS